MADQQKWIDTKLAAAILQTSSDMVRQMVYRGQLKRYGSPDRNRYALDEVEALARDPARQRRLANREWRYANRPGYSTAPLGVELICMAEAMQLLAVGQTTVLDMVRTGKLRSFQKARGSYHWFLRSEAAALAKLRADREPRMPRMPKPRRSHLMRKTLQFNKRIEAGDLSWWERHMGDWLTARQVAWHLHTTIYNVHCLRRWGRLTGQKMLPIIEVGRKQWHFRKAEVLALMNDPLYVKHHFGYERYRAKQSNS